MVAGLPLFTNKSKTVRIEMIIINMTASRSLFDNLITMIIPKHTKKQKQRKPLSPTCFLLISGSIIIILFFLLQPRISSFLFTAKRDIILNNYLSEIKDTKKIGGQIYWKFRESYSPGNFEFSREGFDSKKIQKQIGYLPDVSIVHNGLPFLLYTSEKLISVDFLTTQNTLKPFIPMSSSKNILQTQTLYLSRRSDGAFVLIFILPQSEMAKSNGFFDYSGRDKVLTENKNWLNITIIQPN